MRGQAIVLFLAAVSWTSASAQTVAPALLDNLPSRATQTVLQQFIETCTVVTPPIGQCQTVVGDPLIASGADGGNQYDSKGNLYLTRGAGSPHCLPNRSCLLVMTPDGLFRKIADGPIERVCSEVSPGVIQLDRATIGKWSYNSSPRVDALYVATIATRTRIASFGNCNPDGTHTGTPSDPPTLQLIDRTTALISVKRL